MYRLLLLTVALITLNSATAQHGVTKVTTTIEFIGGTDNDSIVGNEYNTSFNYNAGQLEVTDGGGTLPLPLFNIPLSDFNNDLNIDLGDPFPANSIIVGDNLTARDTHYNEAFTFDPSDSTFHVSGNADYDGMICNDDRLIARDILAYQSGANEYGSLRIETNIDLSTSQGRDDGYIDITLYDRADYPLCDYRISFYVHELQGNPADYFDFQHYSSVNSCSNGAIKLGVDANNKMVIVLTDSTELVQPFVRVNEVSMSRLGLFINKSSLEDWSVNIVDNNDDLIGVEAVSQSDDDFNNETISNSCALNTTARKIANEEDLVIAHIGDSNTELFHKVDSLLNYYFPSIEYDWQTSGYMGFGAGNINRPDGGALSAGSWTFTRLDLPGQENGGVSGYEVTSSTTGDFLRTRITGESFDLLMRGTGGTFEVIVDNISQGNFTLSNTNELDVITLDNGGSLWTHGTHDIEIINVSGTVGGFGIVGNYPNSTDAKKLTYHGLGNSSSAMTDWNDKIEEVTFQQQLIHLNPDLVIIDHGTNDRGGNDALGDYATAAIELHAKIKEVLPYVDILFVSSADDANIKRIDMLQYNNYLANVAKQTNSAFLSLYQLLGDRDENSDYFNDNVHFNSVGGGVLSRAFFDVITDCAQYYGFDPDAPVLILNATDYSNLSTGQKWIAGAGNTLGLWEGTTGIKL